MCPFRPLCRCPISLLDNSTGLSICSCAPVCLVHPLICLSPISCVWLSPSTPLVWLLISVFPGLVLVPVAPLYTYTILRRRLFMRLGYVGVRESKAGIGAFTSENSRSRKRASSLFGI
jgi:hypothetical protein